MSDPGLPPNIAANTPAGIPPVDDGTLKIDVPNAIGGFLATRGTGDGLTGIRCGFDGTGPIITAFDQMFAEGLKIETTGTPGDPGTTIHIASNGDFIIDAFTSVQIRQVVIVTSLTVTDGTVLIASTVDFADASGAQAATLTNSPVAGNPTKWLTIDDNGTLRRIPAW